MRSNGETRKNFVDRDIFERQISEYFDFQKNDRIANYARFGGILKKTSSMYALNEIVEPLCLYALNKGMFTPP
ncbi:MAG: hypothetical protein FWG98_09445, partial [Candidatus Cloacimonetes bacterium]|nr:hypothetical protein [Candidatus Cloacimonadota bacterium]